MSDRLLTVAEAAEMLGIKSTTLYQWANERKIPSVKLLGKSLRFRLSEIQNLIKASERPALRTPADDNQGQIEKEKDRVKFKILSIENNE